MKIERDFSFVHPIAPGAKNGVSNGGIDRRAINAAAEKLSMKGELIRVRFNDWLERRDHTTFSSDKSRAESGTIQAATAPGHHA